MTDEIKSQAELRISEDKIKDYCAVNRLAYLIPGEDDGRCATINNGVPCWQPRNYNALTSDFDCNKKSDGSCDYYTFSGSSSNWKCKNYKNPKDPTYGPGNYAIPLPKGFSCTKDGKLPPELCTNADNNKCTPLQRGWCNKNPVQNPIVKTENNSNARYPNCECAYIPNGCPTDKGWKVAKVKGKNYYSCVWDKETCENSSSTECKAQPDWSYFDKMYEKFKKSGYKAGVGMDSAMIRKNCQNVVWDNRNNMWICKDRNTCNFGRCPNPYI